MGYDMHELAHDKKETIARLLNEEMRSEMDYAARYYHRDTEMDLSGYSSWGHMAIHDGYHASMVQKSNNQALRSIMETHVDDGTVEFGDDYMRIRIWKAPKTIARVYSLDDADYGDVLNGEFTDAFLTLYDDVLNTLSNYPILDDDDYYAREWEVKSAALDEAWKDAMNDIVDDDELGLDHLQSYMHDVLGIMDGAEENPVNGKYEYVEVDDDSAWVDHTKILQILEHYGLLSSRQETDRWGYGMVTVYINKPPTREELAQKAAMEFQMGFALG